MQEPETREEWQEAVDAAEFYLYLHSARAYGLVKGGPEINIDRCEDLLRRGAAQGVLPSADAIERMVRGDTR